MVKLFGNCSTPFTGNMCVVRHSGHFILRVCRSTRLTKQGVKDIFSRLGLQRFLFDIGLSGLVIGTGVAHRYYFIKKAKEAVNQGLMPSNEDLEIMKLAKKVDKMNKSDFEKYLRELFDENASVSLSSIHFYLIIWKLYLIT